MPVYTWDFQSLLHLAPTDGTPVTTWGAKPAAPLPGWMAGLATRTSRQLTPAEIRDLPQAARGVKVFETTNVLLPAAKAWADAIYADLDRRYPHEERGPGFFVYETPRDRRLIYDPGFDMYAEWPKMFGKTAPMFTDCKRAPARFRPWTSKDGSGLSVFYDGQRSDWAKTDSLGAPYFGHTTVQVSIDFAYVMGFEETAALLPTIQRELGNAIMAWACRVQPGRFLGVVNDGHNGQ